MAYNPTPNDPSSQDGGFLPDEEPTQHFPRADEAPTQWQPPSQRRFSPAQPEGAPPREQTSYPSGHPASSFYPQPQNWSAGPPDAQTAPGAGQQPSAAPQPGAANYSHYAYPEQPQPPAGATGAPGPTRAARAQTLWRELTLLGQVAGIAGLALFIFFFLPWCFTPDTSAASTPITDRLSTTSHSGWASAAGLPLLGGTTSFNLFPHLWLVLISALALMAIAALLGLHRISQHVAALLITITALVALLLEVLFLVQINSFQGAISELAGGRLNQTLYGVSWGFWLSLIATISSLGMGAYMLYQEYAPGRPSAPYQPRSPQDRQPYPTT
ncbi:MAG TPA: hypothetical protein VFU69_14485 [Ktedonobacterales bacterium]|nr:hypothetical protein [Ktedonobacterales bacterium]